MTKTIHLSPAAYVIRIFGGVTAVAAVVGRDHSAVSKWTAPKEKRGCGGLVPNSLQLLLLEEAQRRGLNLTALEMVHGADVEVSEGEEPAGE